jgi:hypothetical protein
MIKTFLLWLTEGLGLALSVAVIGCSGHSNRLEPPSLASDAGQSAVNSFDLNGDNVLSGPELNACPPLKMATMRIDQNGDEMVSAEEIDGRISSWRNSRIALLQVIAAVRLDGQPLRSADVTLVPLGFLGESIQPAHGKTNDSGTALLRISQEPDGRGVYLGWYSVVISKKDGDQELVPKRYNTNTELGLEVSADNIVELQQLVFDLRSQ